VDNIAIVWLLEILPPNQRGFMVRAASESSFLRFSFH
jgi:hypothetical protein